MNTVVTASYRASKPLAVLLYGAPGSGKGTLGRLLSQVTTWPHISTGELLRHQIAKGTPAGKASEEILRGGYAPDAIVNGLVAERMAQPDCQSGIILDGYPRTQEQTIAFLPVLQRLQMEPLMVRLNLDYTEVKLRLQGRQFCSACGAIFNVVRLPPKERGICDDCGGDLAQRADDRPDFVLRRFEHYATLTEPVERYLRAQEIKTWELAATKAPKNLLNDFLDRLQQDSLIRQTATFAQ